MSEQVILVNQEDQEIGTMEKMAAHKTGSLHRAFSVFIFNSEGKILLQKRNSKKYHSGGLWSNTCCSHPRPGERAIIGATRRLKEEMGMSVNLQFQFTFIYKSKLDNNLTEHELDHVYFGFSDDLPKINITEAEDYKYMDLTLLLEDIEKNEANYTSWFKICLNETIHNYLSKKIA